MKKLTTSWIRACSIFIAITVACGVFVTAMGTITSEVAFAAPDVRADATPGPRVGERLSRLLTREQNVLTRQQNQLTRAGEIVTRIQDYINKQKANGKDTTALEAALASFNSAVANAQTYFNTAKSTLDAKAGFDSNGQVTDIAQAQVTVRTAGKAEREFHLTARQAIRDLRQAARDYRTANRPKTQENQGR